MAASRTALGAGLVLAVAYPILLQVGGYPFYQTIGFLVLLNAMLGVGWNVIGGWAGQFDFGPQVFFASGAYVAALLLIHLGLSPWIGMPVAVAVAMLICAVVTYPLTRLRGHYFLIPISQIMSTTLCTGPLAGRGIDLIVYGLIIIVIAAIRPTGILSLPWGRWLRRSA